MRTKGKGREKVFTSSQIAKERAALLQKRLGVLPVDVDEFGYLYDPEEFHAALKKSPNRNSQSRRSRLP